MACLGRSSSNCVVRRLLLSSTRALAAFAFLSFLLLRTANAATPPPEGCLDCVLISPPNGTCANIPAVSATLTPSAVDLRGSEASGLPISVSFNVSILPSAPTLATFWRLVFVDTTFDSAVVGICEPTGVTSGVMMTCDASVSRRSGVFAVFLQQIQSSCPRLDAGANFTYQQDLVSPLRAVDTGPWQPNNLGLQLSANASDGVFLHNVPLDTAEQGFAVGMWVAAQMPGAPSQNRTLFRSIAGNASPSDVDPSCGPSSLFHLYLRSRTSICMDAPLNGSACLSMCGWMPPGTISSSLTAMEPVWFHAMLSMTSSYFAVYINGMLVLGWSNSTAGAPGMLFDPSVLASGYLDTVQIGSRCMVPPCSMMMVDQLVVTQGHVMRADVYRVFSNYVYDRYFVSQSVFANAANVSGIFTFDDVSLTPANSWPYASRWFSLPPNVSVVSSGGVGFIYSGAPLPGLSAAVDPTAPMYDHFFGTFLTRASTDLPSGQSSMSLSSTGDSVYLLFPNKYPGNCSEIQASGVTSDGPYVAYFGQNESMPVPLYCFGMATASPSDLLLMHAIQGANTTFVGVAPSGVATVPNSPFPGNMSLFSAVDIDMNTLTLCPSCALSRYLANPATGQGILFSLQSSPPGQMSAVGSQLSSSGVLNWANFSAMAAGAGQRVELSINLMGLPLAFDMSGAWPPFASSGGVVSWWAQAASNQSVYLNAAGNASVAWQSCPLASDSSRSPYCIRLVYSAGAAPDFGLTTPLRRAYGWKTTTPSTPSMSIPQMQDVLPTVVLSINNNSFTLNGAQRRLIFTYEYEGAVPNINGAGLADVMNWNGREVPDFFGGTASIHVRIDVGLPVPNSTIWSLANLIVGDQGRIPSYVAPSPMGLYSYSPVCVPGPAGAMSPNQSLPGCGTSVRSTIRVSGSFAVHSGNVNDMAVVVTSNGTLLGRNVSAPGFVVDCNDPSLYCSIQRTSVELHTTVNPLPSIINGSASFTNSTVLLRDASQLAVLFHELDDFSPINQPMAQNNFTFDGSDNSVIVRFKNLGYRNVSAGPTFIGFFGNGGGGGGGNGNGSGSDSIPPPSFILSKSARMLVPSLGDFAYLADSFTGRFDYVPAVLMNDSSALVVGANVSLPMPANFMLLGLAGELGALIAGNGSMPMLFFEPPAQVGPLNLRWLDYPTMSSCAGALASAMQGPTGPGAVAFTLAQVSNADRYAFLMPATYAIRTMPVVLYSGFDYDLRFSFAWGTAASTDLTCPAPAAAAPVNLTVSLVVEYPSGAYQMSPLNSTGLPNPTPSTVLAFYVYGGVPGTVVNATMTPIRLPAVLPGPSGLSPTRIRIIFALSVNASAASASAVFDRSSISLTPVRRSSFTPMSAATISSWVVQGLSPSTSVTVVGAQDSMPPLSFQTNSRVPTTSCLQCGNGNNSGQGNNSTNPGNGGGGNDGGGAPALPLLGAWSFRDAGLQVNDPIASGSLMIGDGSSLSITSASVPAVALLTLTSARLRMSPTSQLQVQSQTLLNSNAQLLIPASAVPSASLGSLPLSSCQDGSCLVGVLASSAGSFGPWPNVSALSFLNMTDPSTGTMVDVTSMLSLMVQPMQQDPSMQLIYAMPNSSLGTNPLAPLNLYMKIPPSTLPYPPSMYDAVVLYDVGNMAVTIAGSQLSPLSRSQIPPQPILSPLERNFDVGLASSAASNAPSVRAFSLSGFVSKPANASLQQAVFNMAGFLGNQSSFLPNMSSAMANPTPWLVRGTYVAPFGNATVVTVFADILVCTPIASVSQVQFVGADPLGNAQWCAAFAPVAGFTGLGSSLPASFDIILLDSVSALSQNMQFATVAQVSGLPANMRCWGVPPYASPSRLLVAWNPLSPHEPLGAAASAPAVVASSLAVVLQGAVVSPSMIPLQNDTLSVSPRPSFNVSLILANGTAIGFYPQFLNASQVLCRYGPVPFIFSPASSLTGSGVIVCPVPPQPPTDQTNRTSLSISFSNGSFWDVQGIQVLVQAMPLAIPVISAAAVDPAFQSISVFFQQPLSVAGFPNNCSSVFDIGTLLGPLAGAPIVCSMPSNQTLLVDISHVPVPASPAANLTLSFVSSTVPGAIRTPAGTAFPVDTANNVTVPIVRPPFVFNTTVWFLGLGLCDNLALSVFGANGTDGLRPLSRLSYAIPALGIASPVFFGNQTGSILVPRSQIPNGLSYALVVNGTSAFGVSSMTTVFFNATGALVTNVVLSMPSSGSVVRRAMPLSVSAQAVFSSCLVANFSAINPNITYFWTVVATTAAPKSSVAVVGYTLSQSSTLSVAANTFASNANYTVQATVSAQGYNSIAQLLVFYVSQLPLVAVVDQGSSMTYGILNNLTLSATQSMDLDNAPGAMNYSWTCRLLNASSGQLGSCLPTEFNNAMFSSVSSLLVIPAQSLQYPARYVFEVTVSKDIRTSAANITVDTSYGAPPTVQISVSTPFMSPAWAIPPTQQVRITAVAVMPSTALVLWSCTSGNLALVPGTTVLTPSLSNPALVLAPGVLASATSYTFALLAWLPGAAAVNSTATVTITTTSPPSGGTCSVSPSTSGTELQTPFSMSCSGWQTPNVPLSYSFYYATSVAGARTFIAMPQLSPSFSGALLPAGDVRANYTLQVIAVIQDAYGAYANVSLPVVVSPQVFATAAAQIASLQSLISSQLTAAIASSDVLSALRLAATISQSMSSTANNQSASFIAAGQQLLSPTLFSQTGTQCPPCVNGSCVSAGGSTGGGVLYCSCQVGFSGPLCDVNATELAQRQSLRAQLLQSIVASNTGSVSGTTASAAVDVLLQTTSNPVEVSDSSAATVGSLLTSPFFTQVAAQQTTQDSTIFYKISTVISSFVVAVGLGEPPAVRQAFIAEGRNRSFAADQANAVTLRASLDGVAVSVGQTMATGQSPQISSTDAFTLSVQRRDSGSLQGSSLQTSSSSSSSPSSGSNFTLPLNFPSVCGAGQDAVVKLVDWGRNPYDFATNTSAMSARSLATSLNFFSATSGLSCSVSNLSQPILFLLSNASSGTGLAVTNTSTSQCTFYNETASTWDTGGMTTVVAFDNRTVWCQTTHLTTFATYDLVRQSAPQVQTVNLADTSIYNAGLLDNDAFWVILTVLLLGALFMVFGWYKDKYDSEFLLNVVVTPLTTDEHGHAAAVAAAAAAAAAAVGEVEMKEMGQVPAGVGAPPLPPLASGRSDRSDSSDQKLLGAGSPGGAASEGDTGNGAGVFATTASATVAAGNGDASMPKKPSKWARFKKMLKPKFKEEHNVINIICRKPQDIVTRPQRILLLVCVILGNLACNAFFSPSNSSNLLTVVLVSVLSSWMVGVFVALIGGIFYKIGKDQHRREKRKEKELRGSSSSSRLDLQPLEFLEAGQPVVTEVGTASLSSHGPYASPGNDGGLLCDRIDTPPAAGTGFVFAQEVTTPNARISIDDAGTSNLSNRRKHGSGGGDEAAAAAAGAPELSRTESVCVSVLDPATTTTSPVSAGSAGSTADRVPLMDHGTAEAGKEERNAERERTSEQRDADFDALDAMDANDSMIHNLRKYKLKEQIRKTRDGEKVYGKPSLKNAFFLTVVIFAFTAIWLYFLVQLGAGWIELTVWSACMVVAWIVLLYVGVWRKRPVLNEDKLVKKLKYVIDPDDPDAQEIRQEEEDEDGDDGKSFLFPKWFVAVAYLLALLYVAFVCHVCLLYSVLFTASQRQSWYLGTVFGVFQDSVVVEPVMLISELINEVFLSMVTGKFVEACSLLLC